jgi:hypothetical protein
MTFVRNHSKGIVACDFGADAFWAFAAVEQSGRQKALRAGTPVYEKRWNSSEADPRR